MQFYSSKLVECMHNLIFFYIVTTNFDQFKKYLSHNSLNVCALFLCEIYKVYMHFNT